MYEKEISRQNKALFLFLLDQSFSMEEPLGNSPNRKMDELVTAINGWIQNMAIRATGSEGIKDWMDIGVIGYRTDDFPAFWSRSSGLKVPVRADDPSDIARIQWIQRRLGLDAPPAELLEQAVVSAGHRRDQGQLVLGADGIGELGEALIHRDAHRGEHVDELRVRDFDRGPEIFNRRVIRRQIQRDVISADAVPTYSEQAQTDAHRG